MGSSADRYKAILREVARDLEVKPDSELAKHVATLRLMRENIQAKLLRSERVDPDDVLKLDEALRQYLPEKKLPSINVTFVEGVRGTYNCKYCGKENELKEGEYTPVSKPPDRDAPAANSPLPVAADAPAGTAAPAARPMPKANKAIALATKALPTHRGVSASRFHDAVIPDGSTAPLKRLQPNHHRTADQSQRDPHPHLDANGRDRGGHPLPVVS